MKQNDGKWAVRAGALALTIACLGAGAALAATGDKNDPLVSLSYLNQTAIPQVVEQVEANTARRQAELEQALGQQIDQYVIQGGQSGGSAGAGYTLVTMASGQTMTMEVGCEVLLRVGSAHVTSADEPALVDISAGGTVGSGTYLVKNHLYLSTIAGRTLTAEGASVKLLVRGGYTVA